MSKVLAVFALAGAGLLACVLPASAAGTTRHDQVGPSREHSSSQAPNTVNWSQHDTAVYVVSTLNLLHTRSGQSFPDLLTRKFKITHFDVYADQSVNNLYFIQLRKDDGTTVGAFAYTMGWSKPRIVFLGVDHPNAGHAPQTIFNAYHTDTKVLIGSFASTLPS